MKSSIETSVKQWGDEQIRNLGWKIIASENESIDKNIDKALKNSQSKTGGNGGGRPDYSIILDNGDQTIPVFIEYKGTKGKLENKDDQDLVILRGDDNQFDFNKSISKYAVNGACYYAMNVVKKTNYDETLAIGVNGTKDSSGKKNYEIKCYVLNKKNPELPIYFDTFNNFDFLKNDLEHKEHFFKKLKDVQTDPDELEQRLIRDDSKIEFVLQELNQKIHDEQQIIPSERINIVAGSLMAAVGVKNDNGDWIVTRLDPNELSGSTEEGNTDGEKILTKVLNFLKKRSLPEKKRKYILNELKRSFVQSNLNRRSLNEPQTPIKTIYTEVYEKLIPIYDITGTNDFTGKLFNVMNAWVDVPDGGANDVVLTPRYITTFMAKLAQVNKDSYVWDWALGSGGFLISAMNLMIEDAHEFYSGDLTKQYKKIEEIKTNQLLGVELLPNVYILAVLNMILMGDGSSNIVNDDSLLNYDGKYAYNNDPFPANVFLLNPPYSAEGNGMIFVEKAFKKQEYGFGAVIIQDSAGSGKATEINKRILKNNRLKASIKMPVDLFKASVQTSIYLFEVGKPHKEDDNVFFFDLSKDGYSRTRRKKTKVNLRNINDAKGHYQEVIDIILNKSKKTNYFSEGDNYYIGTINPISGNDWNYNKKMDVIPTELDFKTTVIDYLSWDLSNIIKFKNNDIDYNIENKIKNIFPNVSMKTFVIDEIFTKLKHKNLNYKTSELPDSPEGEFTLPALTAGILNQGLNNYVPRDKATIFKNVISVSANGANTGAMFFQSNEFTVLQDSYVIDLKNDFKIDNRCSNLSYLYIVSALQKSIRFKYTWSNKAGWERIRKESVSLPTKTNGSLAFDYMDNYIKEIEYQRIKLLNEYLSENGLDKIN